MTYLLKDIADHLKASPAIDDFFGAAVYEQFIPQPERLEQAIVINNVSGTPEYYLGGEAGTHTTIVQVDVWTDGNGGAKRCNDGAELVRNRLSGYRGVFGTGCYGTSRLLPGGHEALAAPPIDGSDRHRRRVQMDFEIIHTADVPTLT